ncbi:unnamed protein product [Brassica oleracea var. botrytis]|uniref:Peptidase A1 domain-containing protein n=2 Tax=Brassica TaxID=3705 RepID=A0A0D3EE59_BRAOL|nr:unnamed protein product [Brassica napus]CDY13968.1 BnaC09g38580D [Brassica napus]
MRLSLRLRLNLRLQNEQQTKRIAAAAETCVNETNSAIVFVSMFAAITPISEAQYLLPITKHEPTKKYYTTIDIGSAANSHVNLLLDLGTNLTWLNCRNLKSLSSLHLQVHPRQWLRREVLSLPSTKSSRLQTLHDHRSCRSRQSHHLHHRRQRVTLQCLYPPLHILLRRPIYFLPSPEFWLFLRESFRSGDR